MVEGNRPKTSENTSLEKHLQWSIRQVFLETVFQDKYLQPLEAG